ncbi:MAG: ubiquinone/menaquinone biosynthesis methyltransferase [Candidatus Omnitrophica bacterium]|nr:ubiquinone/menaquinone biosynthesis methyltransferase [Candidatus Omnitrophota bacterium]
MPIDLFNSISAGYDQTNRVLSFGLDRTWRDRMREHLPAGNGLRVLDLATGTADVAIAMASDPRVVEVIGIDLSDGMLSLGKEKVFAKGLSDKVRLEKGNALALEFSDKSFDVVTVGFGVRNFGDLIKGLTEAYRVLKPGGRIIALEFSLPASPLSRSGYRFYLKWCVPFIGGLCTGRISAYNYLVRTILAFPYGERFERIMAQVGFMDGARCSLMAGGVTIYTAVRARE